jgi:hypothetical protein
MWAVVNLFNVIVGPYGIHTRYATKAEAQAAADRLNAEAGELPARWAHKKARFVVVGPATLKSWTRDTRDH